LSVPRIPPSGYNCSNRFMRYYLQSLAAVMVESSLEIVLKMAHLSHLIDNYPPENAIKEFDFAHFAMLMMALEAFTGQGAGREIARQAGRYMMATHAQDFGGALRGVEDEAFQALPVRAKLKIGIPAIANLFSDGLFYQATLYNEGTNYTIVTVEHSPMCWGRRATSDAPVCAVTVGVVESGLNYITGGLEFEVAEETCLAQGDDICRFKICDRQS